MGDLILGFWTIKKLPTPGELIDKHSLKVLHLNIKISSVQISRSVVSDFLRPHESQHARPPCPSPTLGVHSDSCPSSQWCRPAISSSVVPFSSFPQSLPASESFPVSQLFAWGGQSTGVSALASFLPKKSQGWSPSEWTGWISLKSKGLSSIFSNTTVQKHQFFSSQISSQSNCHIHTWPQDATPWTVARQLPLSMESSRQEYWSGLPFPSPGESSRPRDWTWISRIAGGFFTTEPPGKSKSTLHQSVI